MDGMKQKTADKVFENIINNSTDNGFINLRKIRVYLNSLVVEDNVGDYCSHCGYPYPLPLHETWCKKFTPLVDPNKLTKQAMKETQRIIESVEDEHRFEPVAKVLLEFNDDHPLTGRDWTVKEFIDDWLVPKGLTGMCMCPYCVEERSKE